MDLFKPLNIDYVLAYKKACTDQPVNMVDVAASVATCAHANQLRKYTNEPYVNHCRRVARIVMLSEPRASQNMIIAAWLHDLLEDTACLPCDIETVFNAEVLALVQRLTDVSTPQDGTRAERKRIDREHVAAGNAEAHTIKLADLLDNTRSIAYHDPRFARECYLDEKEALLEVLDKGNPELRLWVARSLKMAREMVAIHEQFFKNEPWL